MRVLITGGSGFTGQYLSKQLRQAGHEVKSLTSNLSDLDDAVSARSNLGLGSAAIAGDASESQKGITQIATQNEVDSGIDDQKTITPHKLRNLFNSSSLSSNGYIKIPILEQSYLQIIIQWGKLTNVGLNQSTYTVNFSTPFPNALLNAQATISYNSYVDGSIGVAVKNLNLNSMQIFADHSNSSTNGDIYWIAIGF